MRLSDPRLLSTVAITAAGVWAFGMLALGAIVAPIVFGMVPAPFSADAMTVVFLRFDKVAMSCAGLVLLTELPRGLTRQRPIERLDVARMVVALVAGMLAILQGTLLSPKIAALHQAGAIRGLGPAGLELERVHTLSEQNGKAQLLLVVFLIALHVWSVARPAPR